MIRLRGHHLICLHFFQGEGYSQEFVDNLQQVVTRAEKGDEIEIVAGSDDVCRLCPSMSDDTCAHDDEEIRKLDRISLKRLEMTVGDRTFWHDIKSKLQSAPEGWLDAFCEGCYWEDVCGKVK